MEISESKTQIIDKKLERVLDNFAPLELRQKEFCLKLRTIPENSEKILEKGLLKPYKFIWIRKRTLKQKSIKLIE